MLMWLRMRDLAPAVNRSRGELELDRAPAVSENPADELAGERAGLL
jgi:hypothetical protein